MSDQDNQTGAEAPAAASPEPQPVQTVVVRKGGAGTVVLAVILSAVVSVGAVVSAPLWQPGISRLLALPDPLRTLAAEDARLGRAQADLDKKVAALSGEVAALAGTAQANAAAVADLRTATLAIAAGELRNALHDGGPFAAELAAVRAIAGADAAAAKALEELAAHAATGVPSFDEVKSGFPYAAAAAVAASAEPAPAPEDGWTVPMASMASMLTQFRYLVRLETPPADSPYATAQRARTLLGAGDLGGAMAELGRLPGAADPITAEWLAKARGRAAADQALAALTSAVTSAK